jgi:hypothetical protein
MHVQHDGVIYTICIIQFDVVVFKAVRTVLNIDFPHG